MGAAGRGCISSAVRADLASAAATVLATHSVQSGAAYELAGDAYTLAELATEISRQSGNPVVYRDLEEAAYKAVPTSAGLAEDFAQLFLPRPTPKPRSALSSVNADSCAGSSVARQRPWLTLSPQRSSREAPHDATLLQCRCNILRLEFRRCEGVRRRGARSRQGSWGSKDNGRLRWDDQRLDGCRPRKDRSPKLSPHPLPSRKFTSTATSTGCSHRAGLSASSHRNLELIWLTGRLAPDFKTVADFRRDNGVAIRKVCARFVALRRNRHLLYTASVAIDGSIARKTSRRIGSPGGGLQSRGPSSATSLSSAAQI